MKPKNKALLDAMKAFPIGVAVRVTHHMVRRFHQPHRREWVSFEVQPYDAWVVGAKWLCDGVHVSSRGYDEDYEPGYLKVSKKTPVLLVRRAMFSKEVAVPVEGVQVSDIVVTMNGVFAIPMCPMTAIQAYPYTDRDREEQRGQMKKVPRDEKGRWMKMPGHERHPGSV